MNAGAILVRCGLALVGAVSALLMSEGAYSLSTGRSLASFLLDRRMGSLGEMRAEDVAARADVADGSGPVTFVADDPAEGKWTGNIDPGVGMTMKRHTAREIMGAVATTDRWGHRVRVGPEPEEGALRVVVLGDSVAFGFGLPDDQTIAHHLEQHLARVVPPGSPRPVAFTIACPGWNTRNEVRYVLDHLARLDPDVVVLLPVENDLDDQFMIGESGIRGTAYDPVLGAVRPHVSSEHWVRLYMQTAENTSRAEELRRAQHGNIANSAAYVAETGLTPWSIARWDEIGGLVEQLDMQLDANGAQLVLVLRSHNPLETMFDELVRSRLPHVPTRTFFPTYGAGDHLEGDSHPTGRYAKAAAWCIADEMLEQGQVPGGDRSRLGAIDADYADRLAPERSLDEVREQLAEARHVWREFIGPQIDTRTGIGFHQVYGGVGVALSVGPHVLVALENDGGATRLELAIERLPASSAIYPLTLTPTFNGVRGASREVPAPADASRSHRVTFDVPAEVRDAELIDVQIDSSSWRLSILERRRVLLAYHFVGARFVGP